MGVDFSGMDVLVPEQFLHRANVRTVLEHVGRETVAQSMWKSGFDDLRSMQCFFDINKT